MSHQGRNFAYDVEIPEESILKVSATTDPQSVASAITNALYESNEVPVRAVGAGAVNQAAKGVAIARGYVAPRGLDLVCRVGFLNIPGRPDDDGRDKTITAVVFRLFLE